MARIRLVTRADDAGLNPNADRAIRASVRQGIARNVSLLAPAPSIMHAAEALLDLRQTADFGFHVCLTAEWNAPRWGPVSNAASVRSLLRKDGTFPATAKELEALSPNPEEMMVEVEAQYRRLQELGFTLGYVDEHMGVGAVAGLAERLAAFAEERGLVYDRSLRSSGLLEPLPGWKGPREHPGTELADHLASVAPGTYLLVGHPAFKSESMERLQREGTSPGEVMMQRNRERRMFTDIEIVDYCETSGAELVRYSHFGPAR